MANSITLSQSLVDDIAQKIADGTATAEQVVLYTKGLNQLQTGNDFQAVVIGLSQSAVDAIDSANAQFQEDAQNALTVFSQTATNIDNSATNAVSAINAAKDLLVATDAEISTTISSLPSLTFIREAVQFDRDYIHPYDRPAFWTISNINQADYEAMIVWYNHWGKEIKNPAWGKSQVQLTYGNIGLDTASNNRRQGGDLYSLLWNAGNNEPWRNHRTPTTNSGYEMGFGNARNMYGHVMGTFDDITGAWVGYNGNWTDSWMRDTCVIVGDTDRRWYLVRESANFWVGGSRNIVYAKNDSYNRAYLRDPAQMQGLHHDYRDELWERTSERFTLPAPVSTGYGNVCYNRTLNQMVVMLYNGTAGVQKPLLYSFSSDWDIKEIALGNQAIDFNYSPTANGKMTLEIESTVDNSDGKPGVSNLNESSYRGVPILCDNGNIVHFMMNGNNISGSAYAFRWRLNSTGDDYEKDAHFTYTGNTTLYGYDSGPYYGVRHSVTNDGRYVVAYCPYYYYHCGIRALFVRVSDGKVLKWTENNTTWGWSFTPVQANKMILHLEPHHAYNLNWQIDFDYIFSIYGDGVDVNFYSGGANAYPTQFSDMQQQPYTSNVVMYKGYSDEMKYISPVDHVTDIRTIS